MSEAPQSSKRALLGGQQEFDLKIDQLCDRFEAAWQTGRQPRIEDYLKDRPGAEQAALLRELLRVELWYRRVQQERPALAEYLRRFADHGDLIQLVFKAQANGLEAATGLEEATGSERAAAEESDAPGCLGRYRLTIKLGAGAFGVVYKGHDDDLRRDVAIKVPHRHCIASHQDAQAYLNEARNLAGLDHPGIVPVYDFGRTDDGLCYLVSKFVEGSDLKSRLKQARPARAEAVALIARVAEALHHAHRRGLVHRDIKPANILLDTSGQPLVTDFGLALREEDFGKGPAFTGTPAYMSPEQARGEGHRVDARTDIFALGIVLYELLTGRRPFQGDHVAEVLDQIKTLEPRPPRQLDETIPKELDRICLKALSKRASDRYSTALDLAADLRHWLAGPQSSVGAPVPGMTQPAVAANVPPVSTGPAPVPDSPWPSGLDSDPVPTKVVPKGLRSFDAEDADFFLELLPGPRHRDGLPESLRFWKMRIEATDAEKTFRVGLLYGPSGCGKSSLVKAGLLPRLAAAVPLYVEATAVDTETRLLKSLQKRFPNGPEKRGLVETMARLRRQPASSSHGISAPGRKVLLVLDQFEQWLHAQRGQQNTELVEALRQCDGEHVQCLLLVRDDFGMAAARFLNELEIPILEGQNFATVDLFDPAHARKVLMAFGRAFGNLPDHRAELTPAQEQFLDQAVAGLAQDGKVISVRLALFAEMVKGKAWTPATLKAVGGIAGLGVTFLEETLGGRTTNPERRLHQRAASAVLKALLPEQGTDIKGHTRSQEELLEASGYTRRPQAFDALLRILDTELRLITPAEAEEKDEGGGIQDENKTEASDLSASSFFRYYQLTHDYLVPALRQWLTRKQRETRRGRMELLLAERTALWSAKQEGRQLPGWWEWGNILLFTQKKDWTATQQQMLRTATRKHFGQAGVLAIVFALIGWALWAVMQGPLKANQLVQRLIEAETVDVPQIIAQFDPSSRRWADPKLRALTKNLNRKWQLHARLALLPVEPEKHKKYLYEKMLETENPQQFQVIVEAFLDPLANHYQEFVQPLWELLETETDFDRRLHALCALANYDPSNPQWEKLSQEIANRLVQQNILVASQYLSMLIIMRDRIGPSLRSILRDPDRPESERTSAARLFFLFEGDVGDFEHIRDVMLEIEGETYDMLFPQFRGIRPQQAVELTNQELDKKIPPDAPEEDKDVRAKRRAHAAVMLLQLDQDEERLRPEELVYAASLWPMLQQGSDPRVRSYLVRRLGRVTVNPETLLRRYEAEKDESLRRALLLSLGQFDEIRLRPSKRQALVSKLLEDYRTHADAGVHSAAEWLLRQWGQQEKLQEVDKALATGKVEGNRWYRNSQGQTLAVFPPPGEFAMGSSDHEPGRMDGEVLHSSRIPRSFALATKEVTVGQFQQFLQQNPEIAARWGTSLKQCSPEEPIVGVTWLEAAQYCRWLSDREGVSEEEMCYPPVQEIKAGMKPIPGYLSKTGYRLPTEAEWEYACRAGAATSRHFGGEDAMLDPYAWYARNARGRVHAVGSKMPNDFGLFDMYGNAAEWCHDAFAPYPKVEGKTPREDTEDPNPVDPSVTRVLRGGAYVSAPAKLRSASRFGFPPNLPLDFAGLRVARTCAAEERK